MPQAGWPGDARIAVQFVLNYEEGGESSVLHGDAGSERFLSEIVGAESYPARHMSVESIYEYGSRAGVWRLLREFERRSLPLTVFGVAMALERNPDATAAFVALGHEIACHGWRWIHYQGFDPGTESAHMRRAVETIRRLTGSAPQGWYTGRDSPHTRRLVVEHGGFLYDSDNYGDDLPFWTVVVTDDSRANSSGVHRSRPAAACSPTESVVIVPAAASLPASSGCAQINASFASRGADASAATIARWRSSTLANGRAA